MLGRCAWLVIDHMLRLPAVYLQPDAFGRRQRHTCTQATAANFSLGLCVMASSAGEQRLLILLWPIGRRRQISHSLLRRSSGPVWRSASRRSSKRWKMRARHSTPSSSANLRGERGAEEQGQGAVTEMVGCRAAVQCHHREAGSWSGTVWQRAAEREDCMSGCCNPPPAHTSAGPQAKGEVRSRVVAGRLVWQEACGPGGSGWQVGVGYDRAPYLAPGPAAGLHIPTQLI